MGLIDDVLSRVTISDILPLLSFQYRQSGHDYVGRCPSGHDSNSNSSFQINTIEPTFKCWNCGIRGNYIHLIELNRHGYCSTGKGFTDTFKEALNELADRLGIKREYQESTKTSVFDVIENAINFYHANLTPAAREILKKRYGWDDNFIDRERIGYGLQCPSKELGEFFSHEEMLSTGLFNLSQSGTLFHIYQDRIVFPYSIGGQIRYSIGRKTNKTTWYGEGEPPKYFKQYIKKENRPYVSDLIKNKIVSCKRDNSEVFITEGIADYLQLKRFGLNSVSAVTVQFKKDEYDQVIEFCRPFGIIYICNDNDDNQAGQKGASKIAQMLIMAGLMPRIIELPKNLETGKIDAAEFIRDNGIDAFLSLRDTSNSFIENLLHAISPDIDKSLLINKLGIIIELLSYAGLDDIEIFVFDKISRYFKLSGFKTYLTQIKKKILEHRDSRDKNIESKKDKQDEIFSNNSGDISLISSGQDFHNGSLYYTVTKPRLLTDNEGIQRVINQIFVVDSSHHIRELVDHQIVGPSLILNRKLSNEYKADNWTFSGTPYSIESYIKGAKVDPASLFAEINDIFKKYIFFSMEGISECLTAMVMSSYHYMIFHTIGYGHLWAERRSGKTTAMEIMNELGFNARMSSSISDAAIFRMIEMYRPFLLIDEAENLNPSAKQRDNSNSERLELYKSGYKKNGAATRCEGQNNIVTDFSNYCIKVFSSIKTLDSTLEDRTIVHAFKRAKTDLKIPQLIPEQMKGAFSQIRDKLYIYGLEHASRINDIYKDLSKYQAELDAHKITHRSREIWACYLCIGLLVDEFNPSMNCFKTMLETALYSTESKETFSWGDGKPLILLEKFYLWMRNQRATLYDGHSLIDIYTRKDIISKFIRDTLKSEDDELEWTFVNYSYIKQILRRFHVIDKDSEIQKINMAKEKGAGLFIPREKILEALSTYKPDCCYEVLEDIQSLLKKDPVSLDELGVE